MKFLVLTLIRAYQLIISPFMLPACRFTPSCSNYGIDAVQKYGAFKGLSLIMLRLLKCHPFHPGGYDPVK